MALILSNKISLQKFIQIVPYHTPDEVLLVATKAGEVAAGSFTGSPLTAGVTFSTAFADANYSVSIVGADARSWTVASKTAAGFTIESNSATALTGPVMWTAIKHGESS